MKYLPQTELQEKEILRQIGAKSIEDLFASIPPEIRQDTARALPPPRSEIELRRRFRELKKGNHYDQDTLIFAGGGAYNHYIPAVIDPLVSRGEFLTAYTSYQPEVSQGTLQAIYEYQSMLCELTGMDICNASLYDGATSVVEGVLMACRVTRRDRVLVSPNLNPQYLETLRTYEASGIFQLIEWPILADYNQVLYNHESAERLVRDWNDHNGTHESLEDFRSRVATLVVQSPNFYGNIENYRGIREILGPKALIQHVVSDALSLALLPSPGSQGADIVTGEAQSFGIPLSFGGPYLGIFGSRKNWMRQIPGRLVGRAGDVNGKDGFVITLATREQHIRREKATSNICTNQGLMVIRAAIYLSIMGPAGLREAAENCHNNALYLIAGLADKSVELPRAGAIFNEFYFEFPGSDQRHDFFERADEKHIFPGIKAGDRGVITAASELHSRQDLDAWLDLLV